MKCPYCAEEIRDEAVVCRYCGQNLMTFKPLVDRISQLEEQLLEVSSSLERLQASFDGLQSKDSYTVTPSNYDQGPMYYHYVFAILLPVLFSLLSYWVFRFGVIETGIGGGTIFLLLSILCPLPIGFWLGLKWRGTHLKAYALLGIIVGIINSIGLGLIMLMMVGDLPPIWIPGLLGYVLGQALLYITGGLIGDLIEKKRSPPSVETGYAIKLARKIVGNKDKSPEGNNQAKRIAEIITALAPILTFLGSIIGAYLSYKATINKK